MKRLLPVFSNLFHPLFIPAYTTLFYFLVTQSFFYKHEIYLVFIQVLILTTLLPMSAYYLLKSLSLVKSRKLEDKKERKLPLAFYALLLFFLIKNTFTSLVVPELYYYFVGMLISIVAALALILTGHKASLHMTGIASLTLFVISISAYYHIELLYAMAFLIVCSGFVASARLMAGTTTLGEIILGALLGIVPQVGLWFIWLMPVL